MENKTDHLKTLPWKLNIEGMKVRCKNLHSPLRKINFLMNLMTLKGSGIIHLTDLIQITKFCEFHSSYWFAYITQIKSEPQLFLFAQLVGFAGQCKILEVTDDLREHINIHLEHIYRNQK